MMGGFTEGEVAIANRRVWTFFSEGDVMIDVKQPFTGVFPRSSSPWSGWISAVQGMGGGDCPGVVATRG